MPGAEHGIATAHLANFIIAKIVAIPPATITGPSPTREVQY